MSAQIEQRCRAAYDAESPEYRGDYSAFRGGYYAAYTRGSHMTDEQIDAATRDASAALLDFVYEHGTSSEGIERYVRQIVRAAISEK